ncbi:ribosome-associated translation inhibitor RaiA [candidate division WOR-3 bacterium]|nr:ribosome-associated translation inhibitor RaiA [candidate division WOR-3 bacterium]
MEYKLIIRHFDASPNLKGKIDKKMEKLEKFKKWIGHIEVIINGEGKMRNTEINVRLDHKTINAKAKGMEPFNTFSEAFSRIERQIKEYESRATDHHANK